MRVCDSRGTARNLRRMMAGKNINPIAIADDLRVSRSTVYRWLDGDIVPTADHCVALAHLLGVRLDDLIATKNVEDE